MSDQSANGDQLRVIIVDDHPTFRLAARRLLEARGFQVVGEAGCGASALEAVEHHEADAVLLDVRLGDDDGFTVCRRLTEARPELAVVLASDDDYGHSEMIAGCGARGFIHKSRLPEADLGEFWLR
jgi:two-component system response regulator EvgA